MTILNDWLVENAYPEMMCSRIFPGVEESWQFCVQRTKTGMRSVIMDLRNARFVVTSLESPHPSTHLPFQTAQLKSMSAPIKWLGIRAVTEDVLLVFLFEQRTKKYFLATMRLAEDSIEVLYEHYMYVERVVELTQGALLNDENDNLYAVLCWQDSVSPNRSPSLSPSNGTPKTTQRTFFGKLSASSCGATSVNVFRVTVGTRGVVSTRRVLDDVFDGPWFRPVIYDNQVHLRQGLNSAISFPLKKSAVILADRDNQDAEAAREVAKIRICKAFGLAADPDAGFFGPALAPNGNAIHYVHSQGVGRLWSFDTKTATWRELPEVRLRRHALSKFVRVQALGSKLFLHGDCAQPGCTAKAHTHVIDLDGSL